MFCKYELFVIKFFYIVDAFPNFGCPELVLLLKSFSQSFHFITKFMCSLFLLLYDIW
jgi:hypothetical protein